MTNEHFILNLFIIFICKLGIRSVERDICPIATLYSLAAAYKADRCKQGAITFHGPNYSEFCPKIRCYGNTGRQGRNSNDTIG